MPIDHPKLRPIEIFPMEMDGRRVYGLRDPIELAEQIVFVPPASVFLLQFFDGAHSIEEMQAAFTSQFGEKVRDEDIRMLIDQFDELYLLEGGRSAERLMALKEAFLSTPVRPAMLAGKSYDNDPEGLRGQIRELFDGSDGPGLPGERTGGRLVKGAIAPHIDYARGGVGYGWTYKALAEAEPSALYVVLGTSHMPIHSRYAATRKGFDTPFGTLEADVDFIEAVARGCDEDLFTDEFAHRTEHSVELQAVHLRHHFGAPPEAKIAAFLCGSFHEFFASGASPGEDDRVAAFIGALRKSIESYGKPVTVLASADLAHMGAKFGDDFPVDDEKLKWIEGEDRAMLAPVEGLDAEGFFQAVSKDNDQRRICGFASIYTMLGAIRAEKCELLHYGAWHDPSDTVSYASAVLY